MLTTLPRQCITLLLLTALSTTQAQETRSFNQNASRSNHTRYATDDAWSFGMTAGSVFPVKSNENNLFRGNGIATRFFGNYYFGKVGLGLSTGLLAGTIDNSSLNDFILARKFGRDQLQIAKGKPSNGYLLLGPSVRFGRRVEVAAALQGGLFLNAPGSMTLGQAGVARSFYHYEASDKNLFPGFSGNLSIAYPLNSSTRFLFSTGYFQSRTSIRLFDPQRGIDLPTIQERNTRLFTVGVGIVKSFTPGRGAIAGRKKVGHVKYENFSATDEGRTAESSHPVQAHAINTKGTGATNGRMMGGENCGSVTVTTNKPDGSIEEKTFACPEDAAAYAQQESERVIHRDLGTRNILSGRLAWTDPSGNSSGIVTNTNIEKTATTARQTPNTSFGDRVKMGIRESTGNKGELKKYGLIFADQGSDGYASALGSVQDNPFYSSEFAVADNPLHSGDGAEHTNPLFEGRTSGTQTKPVYKSNENCRGISGIDVALVDVETGEAVAHTRTQACGEFFFANVPGGQYLVILRGTINRRKAYDLKAAAKIDLTGVIQQGDEQVVLTLDMEGADNESEQKAGISTSRSNVRTRSITIVDADVDGNGDFESSKVLMEFYDGSVRDVTSYSAIGKTGSGARKVTVRGWDPVKKEMPTGEAVKEYTITLGTTNAGISLATQWENGMKKESPATAHIANHPHVMQFTVPVDDSEDTTETERTIKTKSNIKNDRLANSNSGLDPATPQEIGNSVSKILAIHETDMDEDGVPERLVGGALPGGNILSQAMLRPGAPIKGLIIRGNRSGADASRTTQTNNEGRFGFAKLEAGDYLFTIEETFMIGDETRVTIGDNTASRKGWDGSVKGSGREMNAVESEKSKRTAEDASRKGWDGTVKGSSFAEPAQGKGITEKGIKRMEQSIDDKGSQSKVNTTKSNTKDFYASLDQLDDLLAADKTSLAGNIRKAEEDSRQLRNAMNDLDSEGSNNDEAARAAVDTNFAILLGSVNKLGQRYQDISHVLKTKHDTAKNSINNIR